MSTQRGQKTCDCGSEDFIFVKDLNLAKVWKAGNKYARICVECGNRYFLGKAMWEGARDQYVILDGEDQPVPIFDCPVCEETVTGWPETCPYCDAEYHWDEEEKVSIGAEDIEEVEEDEDEDGPEGLVPVGRLEPSDVAEMDYTTLQKYGAHLDGMKGSGVDEATLRSQLTDRLSSDGEGEETDETEENDATA